MQPVFWTLFVITMNGTSAYPHAHTAVAPEFRSEAACVAAGERVVAAFRAADRANWNRSVVTFTCARNN